MRRAMRAGFVAGLGCLAVAAGTPGAAAADNEKVPDWTGVVTVSDVVGEVVKADDKGLTLRVTWYEAQGGGGANRGRRPSLSANHRNFHNPYQMHRSSGSRPQVKQAHHDYVLEYLPQSLVRHKTQPPKLDDKGRRVPYTDKESHDLRQPAGVPGYAATKADVTPGMIVDVILVRDKTISAAKATEDDLRLKYVYLLGHAKDAPSPSPSPGAGDKSAAKKNN
jgi:hypothetical protein